MAADAAECVVCPTSQPTGDNKSVPFKAISFDAKANIPSRRVFGIFYPGLNNLLHNTEHERPFMNFTYVGLPLTKAGPAATRMPMRLIKTAFPRSQPPDPE